MKQRMQLFIVTGVDWRMSYFELKKIVTKIDKKNM